MSIIQSHINYGITVWGNSKFFNKIHKTQKKSIRIINNKPYNYHTEPLFKINNILQARDLYTLNSVLFMHKLKHNKLPKSFSNINYFTSSKKTETRQTSFAFCDRSRTAFTAQLPRHNFPRVWNNLDINVLNIASFNTFKKKVKKSMLDKYKANIECDNIRCGQCFPVN
jgi:hypothetical protein